MNKISDKIRVLWAYALKDLRSAFRFKISLLNTILAPILTAASFLVTYAAIFFGAKTEDLGFVQKSNYVIYILTGFLVYSIFRLAWGRTSLLGEKVMQTLDGMLLAPRNRLYIMFGKAVQSFAEIFVTVVFFAIAIILLQPRINLFNLLAGVLSLIFLFVIFLSLDFIVSAIGLAEEGIEGFITTYVPRALLLIGCVYYPVDVIPEFARPLVYLNPLYHAVNLFRSAFMTADLRFGFLPIIYLAVLTLVLPILATFIFDFVLKRWGIRGY